MQPVTSKFMVVMQWRMTADEFLALPADNRRTQLIGGELVETDPKSRHQDIVLYLAHTMVGWVEAHPTAGKVGIGCNWRMDDENVFIPDVWFRRPESLQPGDRAFFDGAPDLAVEVRSESTWRFDIGRKREAYLATGAEVWLVDTAADEVLVYRGDESLELGRGETLATPLIPGFGIDLTKLFDR
jgi:Uma2 family endonuclease